MALCINTKGSPHFIPNIVNRHCAHNQYAFSCLLSQQLGGRYYVSCLQVRTKGTRSSVIYPKPNGWGTLGPGFRLESAWAQSLNSDWLCHLLWWHCTYQVTLLPHAQWDMSIIKQDWFTQVTPLQNRMHYSTYYLVFVLQSFFFKPKPSAATTTKIQQEVFKQELKCRCLESTTILLSGTFYI